MWLHKYAGGSIVLLAVAVAGATQVKIHITEVPSPTGEWRSQMANIEKPAGAITPLTHNTETRMEPDTVTVVSTAPPGYRYTWKVVMLIYKSIDCETVRGGVTSRFTYTMTPSEITEARNAITSATAGIFSGSNENAHISLTIVEVGRTLTSLARAGTLYYWPDPAITATELNRYCTGGKADSAIVYWPSRNRATGASVYNDYWGLSYAEIKPYTSNIGYSTVANILLPNDFRFFPGEVFIHEWLHPTGGFYEDNFAAVIPNLDGSGNYRPCPDCANYTNVFRDGYMAFYRDYMRGTVWNPTLSHYEGIQPSHWQAGTPTNTLVETSVKDWNLY